MHYTHPYLLNPPNPVTVNLIGAGGTGSQMLTALAKMNQALLALHHPGLAVTVWDGDQVSRANLGRQLFAYSELGMPKSEALINRTNRFFGTDWTAMNSMFTKAIAQNAAANLTITCVDTVAARREVASILKKETRHNYQGPNTNLYWLDFGNSQNTGQVILATVGEHKQPKTELHTTVEQLPFITDEFSDLLDDAVEDTTPSCSLAEALTKQDLYINPTLAQLGSALLWRMFRYGMTENRGVFLNLADFRTQPLKVA